ncbi:MAG: hypothetical protein AAGD28_13860 [Bacteroidota bacterium]
MHRKRLLILLFFSCLFWESQSQGIYASFSAGPAFPSGTFAASDIDDTGRARIGLQGMLSIGHKYSDKFAIGVRAYLILNEAWGFPTIWLSENDWRSRAFLASFRHSRAIGKKLYLEGELNLGLMYTKFASGYFVVSRVNTGIFPRKGRGISYGLNVGLKYFFDKNFAFQLSAQYLGANPMMKFGGTEYRQQVHLNLLNWGVIFEL